VCVCMYTYTYIYIYSYILQCHKRRDLVYNKKLLKYEIIKNIKINKYINLKLIKYDINRAVVFFFLAVLV